MGYFFASVSHSAFFAVVFFSGHKSLYNTPSLVHVARTMLRQTKETARARSSIRFVAVIVIVMTTVMRGLMRTVPDDFLIVAMVLLLAGLLLLRVLLLPEVGAEPAKHCSSKSAK